MTNKNELNNEELEEVTGGCGGNDPIDENIEGPHGPQLDRSELGNYLGKNVYAVAQENHKTYWGKVTECKATSFKILILGGGKKGTIHQKDKESYFGFDLFYFFEKLD